MKQKRDTQLDHLSAPIFVLSRSLISRIPGSGQHSLNHRIPQQLVDRLRVSIGGAEEDEFSVYLADPV